MSGCWGDTDPGLSQFSNVIAKLAAVYKLERTIDTADILSLLRHAQCTFESAAVLTTATVLQSCCCCPGLARPIGHHSIVAAAAAYVLETAWCQQDQQHLLNEVNHPR